MSRVRLILSTAVVLVSLFATPVAAQQASSNVPDGATASPAPKRGADPFCPMCFYLGVAGEHYGSSHQDGGQVGVTKKLSWSVGGNLQSGFVGEFRAEKEWNGSYALHALAGIRLINDTRFKYPYFYEVTAGVGRYPGETVFELHPSVGIIFPQEGKDWSFFGRVGLPIAFFSGNAERGTEFAAGILFGNK